MEAALGHDSNVNSATRLTGVVVPAYGYEVLPLAPDGIRRGDAYAMLGAGAGGPWAAYGSLQGSTSLHADHSRLDSSWLAVQAGLAWQAGAHTLSAGLHGERHGLGGQPGQAGAAQHAGAAAAVARRAGRAQCVQPVAQARAGARIHSEPARPAPHRGGRYFRA